MKRAIAMKCNQEQFDNILPKLNRLNVKCIDCFDEYNYLINNLAGVNIISNILSFDKKSYNREVHEEWNEKIFLEACGIEVKETFTITKEQVLKYNMKDEFPEVFETNLEIGKWYKSDVGLFFVTKIENEIATAYGFDRGLWNDLGVFDIKIAEDDTRANPQEVEAALVNEAKNRYKIGQFVFDEWSQVRMNINQLSRFVYAREVLFVLNDNNSKIILFHNGKWAEIIPTKTKEEAEKLLNCKIV